VSSRYEGQWIQSIRSLRRYNRQTAVHLFLYDTPPEAVLHEADRQRVQVHRRGGYRDRISALHPHGSVLANYPTFHKFMSLCDMSVHDTHQLLYLDCDTFFFDDVDRLFELYGEDHWIAREEPRSRLSHLGLNLAHLDEEVLDALARREGLRSIWPFNSGVCLLNHGIWHVLERLQTTYFETAWRLLVGRHLPARSFPSADSLDAIVGREVVANLTEFDRIHALPFPSDNHWIVEQITLWLTLGRLPYVSQGLLARHLMAQGGESLEPLATGSSCVLAHYFSTGEAAFFATVNRLRG
jgi:hypothetical protein